eukprot:403332425
MSYINPENALKHAQEFKAEGNIEGALEELHQALHGKKFKGNNIILERIMLEMIDICSDQLSTAYLKEDIGHFRNVCQHTNMSLLENVLKTLKARTDQILIKIEEQEGEEKLRQVLSDDSAQNLSLNTGDGDINPEDLIVMANCQFHQIEAKNKIMPSVNFFIDVCKIILDTLRQNSKMLDFYNQTAQKCFEFCAKYNYKSEYQKISETLHSHFNQILKQAKHPETLIQSKIPFPVKLDEDDALQKVLELRYQQLKIALKMKVWSDAFRTSENIYQLINRNKHQHHASRMKQILADFFQNLALIFWESDFYLFHAYSLMNLQSINKASKTMSEQQKSSMAAQFVLATLSIPLDNKLSNFERLNVQYIPQGMNEFFDESSQIRNELFGIASMLQVKGIPSRASLINYLKIKNLHLNQEFPQIQELFRLIEEEESPFNISKRGKIIIDELMAIPNTNWSQYKDFIIKTLSVRILQKCKNYFKNLKIQSLSKLLIFFNSFTEIESLLYECNRQNLIQTVIDYQTQSITFNQEVEVANNLLKFGHKLKEAFQRVQDVMSEGKERERIFMKVKEKMEQEMNDVLKRKVDMVKMKENIARTQAEEHKSLQDLFQQQQSEKEKEFNQQRVKEEKERQKNKLLEELEVMRKIRAQEVVQELLRKNIKKINGIKIDKQGQDQELDYDTIMNFYQNLLRKEKEQFEVVKKQKLKDTDHWARALREEEKVVIEKYCAEHGEEEMKQIQKAIADRNEKELKMRLALERAYPVYQRFREDVMTVRKVEFQNKMKEFIDKKGNELKEDLLSQALRELKKIENIRKVQDAEKARKERDAKISAEKKAKGITEETLEEDGTLGIGWGRGVKVQPEQSADFNKDRRPPREDAGIMSRQAFGKGEVLKEEDKKDEVKRERPTYGKRRDDGEDTGFMSRSAMGTQKAEETKGGLGPRGVPSTTGAATTTKQEGGAPERWRPQGAQKTTTTTTTASAGGDSGFTRGPPRASQQANTNTAPTTQNRPAQTKPAPPKEDGGNQWRTTKK